MPHTINLFGLFAAKSLLLVTPFPLGAVCVLFFAIHVSDLRGATDFGAGDSFMVVTLKVKDGRFGGK